MYSWKELDAEFQKLQAPLDRARLDIQWGAAGEHFRLAAYFDVEAKERYRALSSIAGSKMKAIIKEDHPFTEELIKAASTEEIWYRALWRMSRSFESRFMATQRGDDGEDLGALFTGSVSRPASAASSLCIQLLAALGEPRAQFSIKRFFSEHWKWVIGTLIALASVLVAVI